MNSQWDTQRVARTGLIIAVVLASVWMLWHFLPSLAWAVVLAIATWPLREALARRGIGRTWVAAILTLVLAVVVVLPLITLGIEAAHDGGALVQWVREVHNTASRRPIGCPGSPMSARRRRTGGRRTSRRRGRSACFSATPRPAEF